MMGAGRLGGGSLGGGPLGGSRMRVGHLGGTGRNKCGTLGRLGGTRSVRSIWRPSSILEPGQPHYLLFERTNNYMEAWNRKFSVMVGHAHPTSTIWNLLQSVYLEQSNTDENHGDVPPAKRPRQF